jgi:TM2 domain-containing membrane protein YozV
MEQNQVNQLLAVYGSKLPFECIPSVKRKLEATDYETAMIYLAQLKDPTISLILSLVVGAYGVDRFYLGDIGLGVLKLITCGGAGIWWLIDLFFVMDNTRQKNYEMLMTGIYE